MRMPKPLKLGLAGGALAVALSLSPSESQGQFRGGMSNPDESFNRLLQSYGGSGDVVDLAKVPAEQRERMNRFAQMSGGEPLPASGVISRQQYSERFTRQMEAMKSRFGGDRGGFGGDRGRGGFPGGGFPGGGSPMTMQVQGGPPGGTPQVTTFTPGSSQPGMTFSPSPPGGSPFGGSSFGRGDRDRGPGGDRGGMNPTQMTDDQLREWMRRTDRDGDGKISAEEAQRSDRMRDQFPRLDVNRDGFIDVTEYRVYATERFASSSSPPSMAPGSPPSMGGPPSWGGGPPSGWNGPPGGWGGSPGGYGGSSDRRDRGGSDDEERPVAYRYGKLPKELPSWFSDYDTDKDGQVGLYEWRKTSESQGKFLDMDLNADGLLTPDEWLRHQRVQHEVKPGESMSDRGRRGPPGGDRGSSDRGRGPGGGPPSERPGKDRDREKDGKRWEKGEGGPSGKSRNPFMNGGR